MIPRHLVVPLALLLLVPVGPVLEYIHVGSPAWSFLAGAAAIAVLADWVRRATEHIADRVGPAIGGLLNVSFGSLAELILALFVLAEGKAEIVRAQITGSIIGTSLFGLGIAIIVGTIGRDALRFRRERAGLLTSLLILVVVALLLPAVFHYASLDLPEAQRLISDEEVAICVSVVMLLIYAGNLVYTLITHRDVFAPDEPRDDEGSWPLMLSLVVLVVATAVIALEAEIVSGALESTALSWGLSPIFLGVIVLALVGTASDLFAASWFACQGKMGLVLNICVGSAIQIALVVAPVLVLASWVLGRPMTLVFQSPLDLFAIASAAFVVNAIANDGEATWFEGAMLVGVYALLGVAFFFVPP